MTPFMSREESASLTAKDMKLDDCADPEDDNPATLPPRRP